MTSSTNPEVRYTKQRNRARGAPGAVRSSFRTASGLPADTGVAYITQDDCDAIYHQRQAGTERSDVAACTH